MATTNADTVLAFDQRAVQTIQRMGDHVGALRSFYGEHSAERRRRWPACSRR
ncbi:MAG: hypothetical protein M3P85_06425 [Actinomycetota bacterium]|nr:hypothetical protein [Actinomycetota bacterium]